MFNGFRPSAWSVILVLLAIPLAAQDAPAIVATSSGERVRLIASPNVCQMRVQMFGSDGQLLFDSDWKDGNVFDGPAIEGAHRVFVSVKDIESRVIEKDVALAEKSSPTMTLLAHDGNKGMVVNTNGDLSFRFGDILKGMDAEAMRLTPEGELHVRGAIHADKGILMPDGTVLTTARRESVSAGLADPPATAQRSVAAATRLTPHPTFAPAYQFVVGDTGVNVGTTNPAYRLDVTGDINTATQYDLGGARFVHASGTLNTFVGSGSGNLTLSGTNNTGLGVGTLGVSTTATANTAIGASALFNDTTGFDNTGNGTAALYSNTTGYENTGMGRSALFSNTTGFDNTAVGRSALINNTLGGENTAVGAFTLQSNIDGGGNTAVGHKALQFSTSGSNVAVGTVALWNVTTGSGNIGIGVDAGVSVTTGANNIEIGNVGNLGDDQTIRIGSVQSRTFIAGISGITTGGAATAVVIDGNGQLGTISSSRRYKFDIVDMSESTDALMQLRPVKFRYITQGKGAPLQFGLIAEEVAQVYPELVTRNKDGEVESVMYQFLAPMLLNEVQKQRREIAKQQNTIDTLNAKLERLMNRVEQMERGY
jgi:trimeric autotransporter adhesin